MFVDAFSKPGDGWKNGWGRKRRETAGVDVEFLWNLSG